MDKKDLDMIFQIPSLTLNNIAKMGALYKVIMLLLLVFLLGGIGYLVLLKRPIQILFSSQEKYQQAQQKIFRGQMELQKIPAYKARLEALRKLSMSGEQVNNVVKDFSKLGKNSGVEFLSVKNNKLLAHGFYNILPETLIVTGRYQQLADFLNQLLHLNVLVEVGDFSLVHEENNVMQQEAAKEFLVLKIELKIHGISAKSKKIPAEINLFSDPFQRIIIKNKKQANLFADFSLKQLRMVGNINEDKRRWALIASPAGEVMRAQLDDVIGKNNGIIVAIKNDSIKILEETEINGVKEKNWQTLHLTKDVK
jgi:Tfp pilus assembly protein PilO